MEFTSLTDFQRLEGNRLSPSDKRILISIPNFYLNSKSNDVIKRHHAEVVDRILDVRVKYVEEMLLADARGFDPEGSHESWGPTLHEGVQTWIGLEHQTLQTPYAEIYRILQLLKLRPYQHVVDLGAAFGRMGIVIGGLYIKNSFTGYEYVRARVDEGNRVYEELGLVRSKLLQVDLSSKAFELPDSDVYFIYDYGQVEHIDRTLRQIQEVSRKRPVKVVVRGKYTKKIISDRHDWLQLSYEGKHDELFSIYVAFRSH